MRVLVAYATRRRHCRYSDSYVSSQYRALQQFFKWWAGEEDLPDPMARLRPPKVTDKLIPVFTSVELSKLERACQGRSFAQRRDAAIIAVFEATGVRLAGLAGIRYSPVDAERSGLDRWQREITVRGKSGKQRIVKPSYPAARTLDRYLRARSRHAQAWRAQRWLGASNRGPMTARGICQMIVRRGRQCGVRVYPHRFRHHFSRTWLDRGGAEGDLMEPERLGLTADAAPLRRQRPQRRGPPHLRPHHERQPITAPGPAAYARPLDTR